MTTYTFYLDPATAEYVTTTDGVVTARVAAPADVANRLTIEARISDALSDNAAYLAITSPTAAQNTAHLKKLTRQVSGLLRLVSGRLDAAD